MPLDSVLLGLHGAMVAHGYDDVRVTSNARAIVGAVCDRCRARPPCHLTLAGEACRHHRPVQEFPHTDVVDRAEEVLDLTLATIRGEVRPVMSLYDCRQISSYPTTLPVMRAFVDRIKVMEGRDGVLSISVAHCFPYGDVAELSGRVLVISDGDKAKADALATRLGEEFVGMRGKTQPSYLDVGGAVGAAMAANDGPVVMAEPTDNAGGGAPSDNTTILRERSSMGNAAWPIWDRVAVRSVSMPVLRPVPRSPGRKTGPQSGLPVGAGQ